MLRVAPLISVLLPALLFGAGDLRTFTSSDGREIRARIIETTGDSVEIERTDGRRFTVPLGRFSRADRDFIAAWAAESESKPESTPLREALNGRLGLPLFVDGSLWDDPPEEVGKRLGWPRESATRTQSSYRRYHTPEDRIFGARPFSSALYGERGAVRRISIVFANKGDFFAANPGTLDLDRLNDRIAADCEAVEAGLSALLGAGDRQSFGEGSTYRRVSRWDWSGHAFILSEIEDEALSLLIVTEEAADLKGRAEKLRASQLADLLAGNVLRQPNGDVLIDDIPMVDQGPKGYCVPATFERYLRYMDIPADMYLLAASGQTGMSGTVMETFIAGVDRDIGRYGRDLDEVRLRMAIRNIARHIDRGVPILWLHYSTEAFNRLANSQTIARATSEDFAEYEKQLERFREAGESLSPDPNFGHISMIVGYNADTGEIAVSDSWGPDYERRWICIEAGEAVGRRTYVIDL